MTRSSATPYLLILPSLLLTFWIVGYPVWDLANTSVHAVNRFGQLRDFAGLANFAKLFADPLFLPCLWRTLVWTVAVVGGTVLLSVPVALILNEDFAGRGLARVIVMLPWAVSLTMSAIVWRWAMNGQFGMLNATLADLGLLDRPREWLASAGTAFPAEIMVGILVSIPFTATVLLGGLSSLPEEIYEAARIDGASAWQRFRYITFPMLTPIIAVVMTFSVLFTFTDFQLIWAMTRGGPVNATHLMATLSYQRGILGGRLGEGAAIATAMIPFLLAAIMISWFGLQRRKWQHGGSNE